LVADADSELITRVKKKLRDKWEPLGRLNTGEPLKLQIEPLLTGNVRLILTDGKTTVEKFWEYERDLIAQVAAFLWATGQYQGEPTGWRRAHSVMHPWSTEFRRRDDYWSIGCAAKALREAGIADIFMSHIRGGPIVEYATGDDEEKNQRWMAVNMDAHVHFSSAVKMMDEIEKTGRTT